MKLQLTRASISDAELIWRMQIEAFAELLTRYQDVETNPAAEPLEKTTERLAQPSTYFYLMRMDAETVGAIRVVDHRKEGRVKLISPLFVMSAYRGRGIAQAAIREAERIHGDRDWMLDTIEEEPGNCHLYEKMGYHRIGLSRRVNDRMTLVVYRK